MSHSTFSSSQVGAVFKVPLGHPAMNFADFSNRFPTKLLPAPPDGFPVLVVRVRCPHGPPGAILLQHMGVVVAGEQDPASLAQVAQGGDYAGARPRRGPAPSPVPLLNGRPDSRQRTWSIERCSPIYDCSIRTRRTGPPCYRRPYCQTQKVGESSPCTEGSHQCYCRR